MKWFIDTMGGGLDAASESIIANDFFINAFLSAFFFST